MANLAIIPARGGSKRIPRKNIKDFLGKPIIAYSIEAALSCGLFDEVMVSTDDKEIAEIANKFGAKVPFMRSSKNSNDYATTTDVLLEVIHCYEKQNEFYTYGCCIYPTAPLIEQSKLQEAYSLIKNSNYYTVFPIVKFSYSIFRSLKIEDNQVKMIWPQNLTKRSQDLPEAYHDAGQFYFFDVNGLKESCQLLNQNTGAIELSDFHVQDIDNEMDWKLAELKYELLQSTK